MFYLPDLPPWPAIHESAHCVVAHLLDLPVIAVLADHEADPTGFDCTLIGCGDTADALFDRATACAAGVVIGTEFEAPDGHAIHDREAVARLKKQYADLTGTPMPDPFAAAYRLLHGKGVGGAMVTLAGRLRPGVVHDGKFVAGVLTPLLGDPGGHRAVNPPLPDGCVDEEDAHAAQ